MEAVCYCLLLPAGMFVTAFQYLPASCLLLPATACRHACYCLPVPASLLPATACGHACYCLPVPVSLLPAACGHVCYCLRTYLLLPATAVLRSVRAACWPPPPPLNLKHPLQPPYCKNTKVCPTAHHPSAYNPLATHSPSHRPPHRLHPPHPPNTPPPTQYCT